MARRRKRNNTFIIIGGAVAVGATLLWYLLDQQKKHQQAQFLELYQKLQAQNMSAPKSNKAQDIASWVSAVLQAGTSIYGSVAPLFKPGGPFYNKNKAVQDYLTQLGYQQYFLTQP